MGNRKLDALKLMERAIQKEFPKVLRRKKLAFIAKKEILKNFNILSKQLLKEKRNEELKKLNPPIHPWRTCPLGSHWVNTHPRQVQLSNKNPNGFTIVDGYCRPNPTKKDQIVIDEIRRISEKFFKNIKNKPCAINLGFKTKKKNGLAYDELIAGWTGYWNEVFKPNEKLEPDFVKALIASESGFNREAITDIPLKKNDKARGLMQITDQTIKILNNPKGELANHIIKLSKKEIMDPSANIYAGIRWLFHKKYLTSKILGREASWKETIINYKGYWKDYLKNPNGKYSGMTNIYEHYEILKKCQK